MLKMRLNYNTDEYSTIFEECFRLGYLMQGMGRVLTDIKHKVEKSDLTWPRQHRDAPGFRMPEKLNTKRGGMGDDYQLPSETGGYDTEAESPKGHAFQIPQGRPLRWRRHPLGAPRIAASHESVGSDVRPKHSESGTGRPRDETMET